MSNYDLERAILKLNECILALHDRLSVVEKAIATLGKHSDEFKDKFTIEPILMVDKEKLPRY